MIAVETINLTKKNKDLLVNAGLLNRLKKFFGCECEEQFVLKDVNISVQEGETVAIVGAEGAGKSTLLKILGGVLKPSSGKVSVLGTELKEDLVVLARQDVVLIEKSQELHISMITSPKVLFLDQPLADLAGEERKEILERLKKLNDEMGTTIILTSNKIEDIKMLCKRFIVMNDGAVVFDGKGEDLYRGYTKRQKVSFHFAKPMDIAFYDQEVEVLENTPYKKTIIVSRQKVDDIIKSLRNLKPSEIVVEEEDIKRVVERICEELEE